MNRKYYIKLLRDKAVKEKRAKENIGQVVDSNQYLDRPASTVSKFKTLEESVKTLERD